MTKLRFSKKNNKGFRASTPFKNRAFSVRNEAQKNEFIYHSKAGFKILGETSVRAIIDDVAWDKAVMEVMEEYNEAWTQLADK